MAKQREKNGNSIVASAAANAAACLTINSIARCDDAIRSSPDGAAIVAFLAFLVLAVGTFVLLMAVNRSWPGKGAHIWAAGATGFGAGAFLTVLEGYGQYKVMAAAVSGMHLGWVLELTTGWFASLAGFLDRLDGEKNNTSR